MQRILVVEDDELIAALERDYLEANGYEAVVASDGSEGLRLAREEDFDLLLLDVMLPGVSGFDICREVRREKDVPIVLVTAKREDVDKIRGLGLGADDYVVKPFSPSELVARVRAHIRIHERLLGKSPEGKAGENEAREQSITVGELRILLPSHRVFVRGAEVSLTNREYELLAFMASNPNIVFSREQLFDRVWGMDAVGDTATVTVHINRIREKIERDSSNPEYIETVWGAGYRFTIA